MDKRLILMLIFIVLFHVVCNRDVNFELPTLDDPCDTHFCRTIEIIEHEEQKPIIVREKR